MSAELREDILANLELLDQMMQDSIGPVREVLATSEPTRVHVYACAAILNSFYNVLENAFKRIAWWKLGHKLAGPQSHADLLRLVVEPPVQAISPELAAVLKKYLDFRHWFVHGYTVLIRWEKMAPLVRQLDEAANETRRQLQAYINTLSESQH